MLVIKCQHVPFYGILMSMPLEKRKTVYVFIQTSHPSPSETNRPTCYYYSSYINHPTKPNPAKTTTLSATFTAAALVVACAGLEVVALPLVPALLIVPVITAPALRLLGASVALVCIATLEKVVAESHVGTGTVSVVLGPLVLPAAVEERTVSVGVEAAAGRVGSVVSCAGGGGSLEGVLTMVV